MEATSREKGSTMLWSSTGGGKECTWMLQISVRDVRSVPWSLEVDVSTNPVYSISQWPFQIVAVDVMDLPRTERAPDQKSEPIARTTTV